MIYRDLKLYQLIFNSNPKGRTKSYNPSNAARYRPGRFWAMKVLRWEIISRREETLLFCLLWWNSKCVAFAFAIHWDGIFIEMDRSHQIDRKVEINWKPGKTIEWLLSTVCWIYNRAIFQYKIQNLHCELHIIIIIIRLLDTYDWSWGWWKRSLHHIYF